MTAYPTFLIPDLFGLIVNAPLAAIFFLVYWKLERRQVDLLFASMLTCSAAACLVAFI